MWPRTEDYGSIGKSDIVIVIPDKRYVVIGIKNENGKSKFKKLTDLEKQIVVTQAVRSALPQIEEKHIVKSLKWK